MHCTRLLKIALKAISYFGIGVLHLLKHVVSALALHFEVPGRNISFNYYLHH